MSEPLPERFGSLNLVEGKRRLAPRVVGRAIPAPASTIVLRDKLSLRYPNRTNFPVNFVRIPK